VVGCHLLTNFLPVAASFADHRQIHKNENMYFETTSSIVREKTEIRKHIGFASIQSVEKGKMKVRQLTITHKTRW